MPQPWETPENLERWLEATPKVVMALCEAGYPCTWLESNPRIASHKGIIRFDSERPPDGVLLKAAELAGIRDLIEIALSEPPTLSPSGPSMVYR